MKAIKYIIGLSLFFMSFYGCEKEDNFDYLNNIELPTNISALFEVEQDNSGTVTITPKADGASKYKVFFGDGTDASVELKKGEKIQHTYVEGTYDVKIEAYNLVGEKAEATKQLNVMFRAPENLQVTAEVDTSNPFQVNVSATADFAASFNVFFDTNNADEDPTPLAVGETVSFQYDAVGDYTIRVVALSGGSETTEATSNITINVPVVMPIDFEAFDASKFIGFGGVATEVVDNPDTNGNTSSKVGKIVKGGPETWAGSVIIASSPIDFSVKKLIKLDVWSPRAGGKLLMKLENLNDAGTFVEKEVTLQGNSAWEEVTVDFSDIDTSKEFQKIVVFFDIGTVGDGGSDWTFYIDNIKQALAQAGVSKQKVQDFEAVAPSFTVFGDIAATEVVDNPDVSGENTTSKVAKLTKTSGSQVWAGTFFETSPLDLTNYSKIKVATWSPKAGVTVKLKLENADASVTFEKDLSTTVASAWEELVYDFSEAPVADYVKVVIFYDFGNAGDGSVYYFDEIELVNDSASAPLAFQDFEAVAPSFTVFGDIVATEVIDNLDASRANTTSKVAKLTKTSGSQVWAGTFFETSPLDLTNYSKIKVATWSPKAGVTVKLKLENADGSVTFEKDLSTTVANTWEELVYDFSEAPVADYVKVVIFFDFGNAGDDSVYYFDEFTLTN